MARQVKKFGDHSARWQREAKARGLDPKKWDRWRTLSTKSRRGTTPTEYATGKSVREQFRAPLLDAAARRIQAVHTNLRGARRDKGDPIKLAAIRRNLNHPDANVSNARLRRIASMPAPALAREIDASLSRRYGTGDRSPYWYEKRG